MKNQIKVIDFLIIFILLFGGSKIASLIENKFLSYVAFGISAIIIVLYKSYMDRRNHK